MTAPLDIVDIHAHLWPPAWRPGGKYEKPAGAFSPEIHRKITTPQALVDELEQGGVSLAVVTATIESLFGLEASIPLEAGREANDWLATLSREHSTLPDLPSSMPLPATKRPAKPSGQSSSSVFQDW
ncbi:hypothetical protein N185_23035 [Sinorhizobium sp. GW3]|nr:hypothetical protein N185_23035 [Sinorhizobium sp. GW3]